MSDVPKGTILAFFAWHCDEITLITAYDLEVPYYEAVLKGYGRIGLQFLFIHRENLHVCYFHLEPSFP